MDDEKPQAAQPPADNPATWNADVAHIFELHPALQYGQNKSVMQEKLNALGHSGLNYHDMLETAYQQTLDDRRWSSTP